MPCPTCGGFERMPIAPGYWECTSSTAAERWEPAGPGGAVIPVSFAKICGQRYQEGRPAGLEECACRTYAIGHCAICGVAVCGERDCSRLVEGRRLCLSHWEVVQQDKRNAEMARRRVGQAQRQIEWEQQQARHEQLVVALQQLSAENVARLQAQGPSRPVVKVDHRSTSGGMSGRGDTWWQVTEVCEDAGWDVSGWLPTVVFDLGYGETERRPILNLVIGMSGQLYRPLKNFGGSAKMRRWGFQRPVLAVEAPVGDLVNLSVEVVDALADRLL
jgi:hypothetical protein